MGRKLDKATPGPITSSYQALGLVHEALRLHVESEKFDEHMLQVEFRSSDAFGTRLLWASPWFIRMTQGAALEKATGMRIRTGDEFGVDDDAQVYPIEKDGTVWLVLKYDAKSRTRHWVIEQVEPDDFVDYGTGGKSVPSRGKKGHRAGR